MRLPLTVPLNARIALAAVFCALAGFVGAANLPEAEVAAPATRPGVTQCQEYSAQVFQALTLKRAGATRSEVYQAMSSGMDSYRSSQLYLVIERAFSDRKYNTYTPSEAQARTFDSCMYGGRW